MGEAIGVDGAGLGEASLDHMLQSHVLIDKVRLVAQEAQAKHLVVSHYADLGAQAVDVRRWRRLARQGYDGQATIGQDLNSFTLPAGADDAEAEGPVSGGGALVTLLAGDVRVTFSPPTG